MLACYLEENKRMKVKLTILTRYIRNCADPFKFIKSAWNNNSNILTMFKIVILIHECLRQEILPIEESIRLLSLLGGRLKEAEQKKITEFDRIILEKGVEPYILYLQKKLQA